MNKTINTHFLSGALVYGHGISNILIEDNRISAIAPDLICPAGAEAIELNGKLIFPGLINTHHHLAQSLLKAVPAGINHNLQQWLGAVPYQFWPHYTPDTMYAAAMIGFSELLQSGCTTCADHHYLYYRDSSAEIEQALLQAANDSGIRFVLCRGISTTQGTHRGLQHTRLAPETIDQALGRLEQLRQKMHSNNDDTMSKLVVAPTSLIHSSTPNDLQLLAHYARQHGLRLHSHLLEVIHDNDVAKAREGISAIDYADSVGWLGNDVWFAHMVFADANAIAKLGANQTGISHCPTSNCRLGSGIAPIPKLQSSGAQIALGVDGSASAESGSMINELMQSWLMHRTVNGASSTTVESCIDWATVGGAKVLGYNKLGSLQVGMLADLAIYNINQPRFAGIWEPEWIPVVCGEPLEADYVMVNGKWRIKAGKTIGFDTQAIMAKARQQLAYLKTRLAL